MENSSVDFVSRQIAAFDPTSMSKDLRKTPPTDIVEISALEVTKAGGEKPYKALVPIPEEGKGGVLDLYA